MRASRSANLLRRLGQLNNRGLNVVDVTTLFTEEEAEQDEGEDAFGGERYAMVKHSGNGRGLACRAHHRTIRRPRG
jgi:hypothetical protein